MTPGTERFLRPRTPSALRHSDVVFWVRVRVSLQILLLRPGGPTGRGPFSFYECLDVVNYCSKNPPPLL